MPSRNTLRQPFDFGGPVEQLAHAVQTVLVGIEGAEVKSESQNGMHESTILANIPTDTWSRAARRKKLNDAPTPMDTVNRPGLSCRISIDEGDHGHLVNTRRQSSEGRASLEFQWMRGRDRGLFESFMSHVSRKVEGILKSSDVEMIV